jgi:hypothetical protein
MRRTAAISLLLALAACATAPRVPGWVSEPYADRSKRDFVVAVGSGRTLDAAKNDAMSGIAAFLGVEIRSSVRVEARETSGSAGTTSAQSVQEKVDSIIGARLASVVIERAHSEGPVTYVLAVLEKRPFIASLQHEADGLARGLDEGVRAAAAKGTVPGPALQNLATIAASLRLLESRILALGGEIPERQAAILRDGLGFLARFEVRVELSAPPTTQPAAEAPAFDPEDPRLKKAIRDTSEALGHPVEFHFDLAQMPKTRPFFEDLFERFIGLVPRDVERLKQRSPAIFAHGAPALLHVDFGFDGSAREQEITFDRAAGRLKLVMTSRRAEALVPSNLVSYALEADWIRSIVERFSGKGPGEIAARDRSDYFEFLTRHIRRTRTDRLSTPEAKLGDSTDAEAVLHATGLARLVRDDAPLAARVQKWLLGRHELFGDAYMHEQQLVARLAPGSLFKRAEAAWMDWFQGSWGGLTQGEQIETFVSMIEHSVSPGSRGGTWNEAAYPGWRWDRVALGFLDAWVAAGKRAVRGEGVEKLLDPVSYSSQGMRSGGAHRWTSLHTVLLRTPESRKGYLEALLRHRDRRLTETAFVNLVGQEEHEPLFHFWRGLERDEEQWRLATQVIAEASQVTTSSPIYDEAVKLWRAWPKRRGTVLYLLAAWPFSPPEERLWSGFAETFGGPIARPELSAYLANGFRAVKNLAAIWPAIGPGYSRVDALLPHLDAWFDEPLVRKTDFQDPPKAIQAIVHRLREERNAPDLAALHAYLRKRVEARPSEQRLLATLLDLTKAQ